jgi:eukaryotic-like serine/threonine-protein kinase
MPRNHGHQLVVSARHRETKIGLVAVPSGTVVAWMASGWWVAATGLRDRIGSGGMSVVWQAQDEILGRDVAVKVLAPELAEDPDLLRRIHAEARAAAGLRHPHVVAVYDYGEADDGDRPVPYVVRELVGGRSLTDLFSGGALPWRSAVLIGAQVAAALAAAHAHGIVHRDVKPANVMVTAAGVKLLDFGISAAIGEADMTGGQLLGTPAYLAPERLDGGQVRPATDVYAPGLLLYAALAGHLPWQAATTTQMIRAHLYAEPAALPPVAGLPPEVADLCHACLAKWPEDRPTAAEVADALGRAAGLPSTGLLLDGSTPVDDTDPGTATLVQPAGRPRLAAMLAGGAAAVLALRAPAAWSANHDSVGDQQATAGRGIGGGLACTVDYALRHAANGRSATAVTIHNTGQVPVPAWQLSFALPGQQLVRGWTGQWRQTGQDVPGRRRRRTRRRRRHRLRRDLPRRHHDARSVPGTVRVRTQHGTYHSPAERTGDAPGRHQDTHHAHPTRQTRQSRQAE